MHTTFTSILFLLFLFNTPFVSAQKKKDVPSTDIQVTQPKPYDYESNIKYKKIEGASMYLTMRDGNKLAVNVYLPKDLPEGEKIPALLYQTRYWRGAKFSWPFSMFLDNFIGEAGQLMVPVILNGYALIAIDARGSGASFGQRDHPWTEDEVKDGVEVVDWIISQPWSNGKVGTSGISYSGTTADFLLVNQHPAVKAAVPMFSLYDVYDDISFPGGVHIEYFTYHWGAANERLDANKLPKGSGFMANWIVKGVQPVKGEKKELKKAIKGHGDNLNVHDGAVTTIFRDDAPATNVIETSDVFSPFTYADKVNEGGAAVYSISGWMDGSYQHAAIKRHLTLTNPQNKLMLGPWEHGGTFNTSPFNPGKSSFDKVSEILKFFDYHLKGIETGIYDEPSVHYFTMGDEQWKSADSWPPKGTSVKKLYLDQQNQLSKVIPTAIGSFDSYEVDTTLGTGLHTRWRSVKGDLKQPNTYPEWDNRKHRYLAYIGKPLEQDVEVTGHPVITLYLETDRTDGAVFVYLEDVDENGKVTYVTEGQLRLVHGNLSDEPRMYGDADEVPYRTYEKKDARTIIPGEIYQYQFDLLPTSYVFKQGHKVRVSIAGADKDHFRTINTNPATLKVHFSSDHPSHIDLPVMP